MKYRCAWNMDTNYVDIDTFSVICQGAENKQFEFRVIKQSSTWAINNEQRNAICWV